MIKIGEKTVTKFSVKQTPQGFYGLITQHPKNKNIDENLGAGDVLQMSKFYSTEKLALKWLNKQLHV